MRPGRCRAALFAALLQLSSTVAAAPPRPFVTDSYERIVATYRERPLILAFWSLDCAHCREELALLGAVARRYSQAALVLVSTDAPSEAGTIATVLAGQGLDRVESWVFDDEPPERLRFTIDRRWRGELPRTYLIYRGERRAISGRIEASELERWLASPATRE